MKRRTLNNLRLISAAAMTLVTLTTAANAAETTFNEVWSTVSEGPYSSLPEYHTSFSKFFSGGVSLLSHSANRTLDDDSDILPRFQKLVHPIGICFAGTWTITEANNYTGYFANGSKGLIIVRASEAMGNADAGDYRAFGLAGKIFPTTSPAQSVPETGNFFTIDDLGGTLTSSFLDTDKTNEPATSFHFSQLAIFPTITELARAFSSADSNVGIRQAYEVSELGLPGGASVRTPHFIATVSENTERNGASDFRDELRLANFPSGLNFGIYVAENDGGSFNRIGQIHLDQEALSDGCDHRLHFHHPRSR